MYLEAKETARLYKLLSEKLGSDTTEAMFKYIDNKTERSVEASIKTLATKDDIAKVIANGRDEIANVRKEIGEVKADFRKEIGEVKAKISEAKSDNIKWMFLFWVGQMGGTIATIVLLLKK